MTNETRPAHPRPVAESRGIRGLKQPLLVIERQIVRCADVQHGVITTDQLVSLGLGQDAIDRRVRLGRLTRIHRGVFAVGRFRLNAYARWKAATLACGPHALLSHLCAAGLWQIWAHPQGRAHVTLPGNGRLGHEGIAMHRMRRMHPDDRTVVHGIPVTSLELTSLHLAGLLSRRSFERALIKAARRPEFCVDRAVALCARSHGRPGLRPMRQVVARDLTAELRSLSELELRFVEVCRYHRIPLPEVNHDVETLMVDAVWHSKKAIVELDGYEFHKLPRDLRRDNARARRLVLAGYRVIRFVWRDLVDDPGGVARAVLALLNQPR